jgi:hypothetical protein
MGSKIISNIYYLCVPYTNMKFMLMLGSYMGGCHCQHVWWLYAYLT